MRVLEHKRDSTDSGDRAMSRHPSSPSMGRVTPRNSDVEGVVAAVAASAQETPFANVSQVHPGVFVPYADANRMTASTIGGTHSEALGCTPATINGRLIVVKWSSCWTGEDTHRATQHGRTKCTTTGRPSAWSADDSTCIARPAATTRRGIDAGTCPTTEREAAERDATRDVTPIEQA